MPLGGTSKPWTLADDQLLIGMAARGRSRLMIAARMGRSVISIVSRARHLCVTIPRAQRLPMRERHNYAVARDGGPRRYRNFEEQR